MLVKNPKINFKEHYIHQRAVSTMHVQYCNTKLILVATLFTFLDFAKPTPPLNYEPSYCTIEVEFSLQSSCKLNTAYRLSTHRLRMSLAWICLIHSACVGASGCDTAGDMGTRLHRTDVCEVRKLRYGWSI